MSFDAGGYAGDPRRTTDETRASGGRGWSRPMPRARKPSRVAPTGGGRFVEGGVSSPRFAPARPRVMPGAASGTDAWMRLPPRLPACVRSAAAVSRAPMSRARRPTPVADRRSARPALPASRRKSRTAAARPERAARRGRTTSLHTLRRPVSRPRRQDHAVAGRGHPYSAEALRGNSRSSASEGSPKTRAGDETATHRRDANRNAGQTARRCFAPRPRGRRLGRALRRHWHRRSRPNVACADVRRRCRRGARHGRCARRRPGHAGLDRAVVRSRPRVLERRVRCRRRARLARRGPGGRGCHP
jgi:hypothetical protein